MRRPRFSDGSRPLHLIALGASFALTGFAFVGWFQRPRDAAGVLEWLVAAIVIHDLVLMPLYTLVDRLTIGLLHRRLVSGRSRSLINPTPYVRVPAIISALLFSVLFPVILGLGSHAEFDASGIHEHGYLVRWLLLTGALFAISGTAYTVARARARTDSPRARVSSSALH
jgi:hypothetical protein